MSLIINTNINSLNAQRSVNRSSEQLNTAMERLSSGKKINAAADDAAGFAIKERMTAQINGLNGAIRNVNDGLSMFAAGESAAQDALSMLQRVRELAVQAANDTNSRSDRDHLNAEAISLLKEVDRIANSTQFNNQNLLDGSRRGVLQVGTEAQQTVDFKFGSIKTQDLGLRYDDPGSLKHGVSHISSVRISSNDQGEISTRAFFENDWDALRASYHSSKSSELQVDDWRYQVAGKGLEDGQFYIDFKGLVDEGSSIRVDYKPQMEMSTHHQSILTATHTVDPSGRITSKISFDPNDTGNHTRIAYEASKKGTVDIGHLTYKVMDQGIENGDYFIKVDGYVTTEHSVQLKNNQENWGNTWISNAQSVDTTKHSDGKFESKLSFSLDQVSLAHQRADYFAREVGSVLIQGREYQIKDHGLEGDNYFLTVEGLVLDQNANVQGNFSSDLQRNLNIETVNADEVERFVATSGEITSRLLFDARPERAQLYANQGDTIFLSNLDFEVQGSGTSESGQFYLDVKGLVTNGYVSGFITSQMRIDNDMANYEFPPKGISQVTNENGATVSRVTFNTYDASLASSTFVEGRDIMIGGSQRVALAEGITGDGDYFIDIQGTVDPDSQMSVSSLHNPYFWWGDSPTNVSQVVDSQGQIKTELEFSNTFQANMVSQRSNSSDSLEINGNTFSVLSEGHRDDGTYFVSVKGYVGDYSWVEYSSPTNMDALNSSNSLRVSSFESVPQSSSAMAKTRVYFEEGWAAMQASSAVRGNDQFDYAGHSLVLLGEGVDDSGDFYIEVQGSFQKQDGEDFWLNLVNRPRADFGWNGSDIDSVSYMTKSGSDKIISSVTLDASSNTTSLSYSINQSGVIVAQEREFNVLGQSVNSSGQLVLQIDGYIYSEAHLHSQASVSNSLPSVNGLNNPLSVSYSTSGDGKITSKLELGSGWEAQRADFVGDKYGKILIDNLPFQVVSEELEENGNFSLTVEGYAQPNRHLGYLYNDNQNTNNWFGHVEADHQLDARGEVISRIKTDAEDGHHEQGFAYSAVSGSLTSNGHKLNVIGYGVDENDNFYADVDGFVQDGAGLNSLADNAVWTQRNHLGAVGEVEYAQSDGSVQSIITIDDINMIQRVSYFAQQDGVLSIDDRDYKVVGESLESDGSYRLSLDGFIRGDTQIRANSYSMYSQKVHFDVASIEYASGLNGGVTSTISLEDHVNAQEIAQYVDLDEKFVSDGLSYQVLDNGVDDSGKAYLVVAGYVASNSSIGTLSDINATDERFNQANLHIGHVQSVEVFMADSTENSRLFFHSEQEGQLASQFAEPGTKLFIDQQEFEVIGAGLQADSYYLEVRGVATTGQVWSSSEPATDLNNWIGHPASISHQVNAADLVTSTLTYGEQQAQGASLSVSAGDRVYNDIRGAGYKVLETGVTEGEFFIKVEGYVFDDHGLSSKTGPKIQANDHISSIHEGNSEVLAGQDGVVRSKLLITDNAQELAKAVESGEQLFFDSRELTVESMSIDGDDFYLVVQGMISSGGIQKRSESVETTFVDLQQNAGETIEGISAAMEKISEQLAGYGATQNRLAYSVSNLMTVATQTESARSRIEDADFAVESARLAKAQVLQQSGAAMLAQANASSQLALSLIR